MTKKQLAIALARACHQTCGCSFRRSCPFDGVPYFDCNDVTPQDWLDFLKAKSWVHFGAYHTFAGDIPKYYDHFIETQFASLLPIPPNYFEFDGCSGGFSSTWKKLFNKCSPFELCCFIHDVEYYHGCGPNPTPWDNFKTRLKSDNDFFKRIWRTGVIGKLFAPLMWIAVRLGGGSYWNKTYSWGFGWRV